MQPKTSPNAMEVKICTMCKDAWVENPRYNYCPHCMNDYYYEHGLEPARWYVAKGGFTRAYGNLFSYLDKRKNITC
jgi:hypothetical protein